ncbi:accessory factor UbiK family protein [Sphingorhabdus sp. Alg239-R122]|uniref:accessory factor UbiK family protein n=1 Tax=Sphingorhabdus sp. Alg239-R122 TaxID=2305989 RepID=UPI0013DD3B58|nr:accessory factor UbiK family protein [Sphingorhabdus sp. Alg239-R122]
MQSENKIFADFAKFINGAAGTMAGMGREAGESARENMREWIAGMDFVSREEFDAVKDMAAKAREETETLKKRVETLEAALAKKPTAKRATRKTTGKSSGTDKKGG